MMREIREGRHNQGLERRKKKHKLLEGAWNMKYIGWQDLHKAKQQWKNEKTKRRLMGARWITYVNILYNIKQQDCCYISQNFNWINHNNMNSNYVSSLNWFRCDWVVYLKVYLFIWWDVNQRILSKDEFLFKLFDAVLKDFLMRLASYSSNTALVTFPPSVGSSILILGPRQTLECILVGSVFPVRTEMVSAHWKAE